MGAINLAKHLTFNKDSFNNTPCRFFSPHLCGLLAKVLKEAVLCDAFLMS